MNSCGCKGIRSCLVCEKWKTSIRIEKSEGPCQDYSFCDLCGTAWEVSNHRDHPDHKGESIEFPGIFICRDFLTTEEENEICEEIYKSPFVESQSGRRKQDYGPKVNFKRKKIKSEVFTGLPAFSKSIYEKMTKLDILSDFLPVEQCILEYVPDRGSSIDPHFDDFWLWGERLVTINLMSDTILRMTADDRPGMCVNIPMLRRSLLVVYGPARNHWMHGIQRHHITEKRLAITYRELSEEFQPGGKNEADGSHLQNTALNFNGTSVGSHISNIK